MPTYQYKCTACGHFFEVVQKFSDDALTVCEECGGRLRKVFNAVGVVFKGSGFYRTDSRGSDPASKSTSADSSSSSEGGSSGSGSSGSGSSAGSESSGSTSSAGSSSSGSGSTGSTKE